VLKEYFMKIASFKHSWLLVLALLIIPAQSSAVPVVQPTSKKAKILYLVGGIAIVGVVGVISLVVLSKMKRSSKFSDFEFRLVDEQDSHRGIPARYKKPTNSSQKFDSDSISHSVGSGEEKEE
jgi:hypothetical protein